MNTKKIWGLMISMMLISSALWATDAATVTNNALGATLDGILADTAITTALARVSSANQQAAISAANNAASAVLYAVHPEALAAANATFSSGTAAIAGAAGREAGRRAGQAAGRAIVGRIPGVGGSVAGAVTDRVTSEIVDAASQDAVLLAVRASAQSVFTAARPEAVTAAIAAIRSYN